jgi:hypothetical protein
MNRRGFIGRALGAVAAVAGVSKAFAAAPVDRRLPKPPLRFPLETSVDFVGWFEETFGKPVAVGRLGGYGYGDDVGVTGFGLAQIDLEPVMSPIKWAWELPLSAADAVNDVLALTKVHGALVEKAKADFIAWKPNLPRKYVWRRMPYFVVEKLFDSDVPMVRLKFRVTFLGDPKDGLVDSRTNEPLYR